MTPQLGPAIKPGSESEYFLKEFQTRRIQKSNDLPDIMTIIK